MRPARFQRSDNTRYGKRHKPGVMNQTETAFASILEQRKALGEVINWEFEAMTFKLAAQCSFTPDFMIWLKDGTMEFVDVKGSGPIDDKSIVKIKAAADKFPMFVFVQEKRQAKRDGGGFVRREF